MVDNSGYVVVTMIITDVSSMVTKTTVVPYVNLHIREINSSFNPQIGSYSPSNGAKLTGQIVQNRQLPTTLIAHKTLQVVAMQVMRHHFSDWYQ